MAPEAPGRTGFTPLPVSVTGITFTNRLAEDRAAANRNLSNGSGVALGDADGDGRCDIYLCGLDSHNVLYRNLGGWKFEDVTAVAGVACEGQDSTGAVFADIDGDGDLDLLVTSLGNGLRTFLNDGHGKFTEATRACGVEGKAGYTSLTLADIDGDGDLDLFVAAYRTVTIRDRPTVQFRVRQIEGRPVIVAMDGRPTTDPELTNRFVLGPLGEVLEYSEESALWINDGAGHFRRASFTDGRFRDERGRPLAEPPRDWALAARFYDFTGDGAPDLYVTGDLFSPDRMWIGDGRGGFRAAPWWSLRHTSAFSMGLDCGDLDRDGAVDFMVVDMSSRDLQRRKVQIAGLGPIESPIGDLAFRPEVPHNVLQWNRGDGTFAEVAHFAGLEASEWSWQPVFLDVDLDGYEDILIPNGNLRDLQNLDMGQRIDRAVAARAVSPAELVRMFQEYPQLTSAQLAFHNRGGLAFDEVGAAWGFNTVGISQGMAVADLDNDGDLDLVVNMLNGVAGVYRNDTAAPRVGVRLKGAPPNTQGIGAKLKVLGGPVTQTQEMVCGGRYLSGDDPMRVFAAGDPSNQLTIEVTWRSGKQSVLRGVGPNRIYEIDEAGARDATMPAPPQPPVFEEVTAFEHRHHEEPFNDFERQPLLPNRLSQLGPGVCWYDLDGDGFEDLVIAAGRGGTLGVYRNDQRGGFTRMTNAIFGRPVARDQTTVLGSEGALLVGSSNYEDGQTNGGCVRVYDWKRQVAGESVLGQESSVGPMALADLDGDGDLDLFVGGRIVPGRYPESADSIVLRNEGGRFLPGQRLEKLGLVSGAVFSDLDGDGTPDLVLACEWGPVRVWHNDRGRLREVTHQLGLDAWKGWWNGVAVGDFDGDGRMDIVAGNWGLNTRYRATAEHPRRLYFGDFNGDGGVSLVESCYDPALGEYAPERDLRAMLLGIPWLQERFTTHQAFAQATMADVLGERMQAARALEVTELASMIFLNRGDHFEGHPLPREAQFAPAFAVCVGDFDGDGREDLFLSQNFFAVEPLTTRNDAGRGLWLRGDGRGGFSPVSGQESGVRVYGDQRGAALCDYDHDGRVDLVVTQNGAPTRLFHNTKGKPGLRARLEGPPGNRLAVGAVLRLRCGNWLGPARELHAGSGYWSQDGAVQVLAGPVAPTGVWVRWPGGRVQEAPLPPGCREIRIDTSGRVEHVE